MSNSISAAPIRSTTDCQCVRCRHKHHFDERLSVPVNPGEDNLVCPRCRCKTFYDVRPNVAWCWASGLIEFGQVAPSGAILIASGPKAFLIGVIGVVARHGKGQSVGEYLVPGVPEADNQKTAGDALGEWLKWCSRGNGHKQRHGVVFQPGFDAENVKPKGI